MTDFEWSKYQLAIFDECRNGNRNVVVRARAGSGKTAVLVEAAKHIPIGNRILFCAFANKDIADIEKRAHRRATVSTLHSQGWRTIRRNWGPFVKNDHKADEVLRSVMVDAKLDTEQSINARRMKAGLELLARAKNGLVPADADSLYEFAGNNNLSALEWPELFPLMRSAFDRCRQRQHDIDYDDMIWLPVVEDMAFDQYDVVFVDEVQDLNPCQTALVLRLCKPGGRIFAVGDELQAIYGFRGATTANMDLLISELDAKILPLPVCYRCPTNVVEFVRGFIPDLEPWSNAPSGSVNVDVETVNGAEPGDFVLSRTRAGALKACLQFIALGKDAYVSGRDDLWNSVWRLVYSIDADDLDAFLCGLLEVYTEQAAAIVDRYERMGKLPTKALELLSDKFAAVYALAERCVTVEDLRSLVEKLRNHKPDKQSSIRCCTVHGAKGDEADRVWVLASTFYEDDMGTEEGNIFGVAITRPKKVLNIVGARKSRGTQIVCAKCESTGVVPFVPYDESDCLCFSCYRKLHSSRSRYHASR